MKNSFRSDLTSLASVGFFFVHGLESYCEGLGCDALSEAKDKGEKESEDNLAGQSFRKETRKQGAGHSSRDRGQKPWEPEAEGLQRRCGADLAHSKTERLKKILGAVPLRIVQNLVGENIHIHHAYNASLSIHDRNGQEFVNDKKFAQLQ
ncbi:MAG: hypothetical protein ACKOF3_10120 [Spartobacteria bacterium]